MTARRSALVATAAATLLALATASPALASGGGGGGGGTGGGGGATAAGGATGGGGGGGAASGVDPTTGTGGSPCVQVGSLSPTSDQSVVTDGAWLSSSYSVSRCGGNNTSFLVRLTADDAAGHRVLDTTDTWFPTKNLPFSSGHDTDTAAFGTAYKVSLSVLVPETGALVTTTSRTVSTPTARVAPCVTATNLGGTAGYYPGLTTQGALWVSWTVKNCGGREAVDNSFTVRRTDTGQLVQDSRDSSSVLTSGGTTGVGLIDVEPVPTGTDYEVRIETRRHTDGTLLDSRSLALHTPDAR